MKDRRSQGARGRRAGKRRAELPPDEEGRFAALEEPVGPADEPEAGQVEPEGVA